MMYHIPGVLSAQDVTWFHEQLNTTDWIDDRTITGVQGAQVKNNQQVNTQSEYYGALRQVVQAAVSNSALFFAMTLPKTLFTSLSNHHQNNETYDSHVGGAVRSHPQNDWMRANLSATLFLGNPNDYEGGELLVSDTYSQHAVKLPVGDLVLYPSSSLRRIMPVTHGVHVASFVWIQSTIHDNKDRAMLFELDKNIQSLKAHHGESSEVLSLLNLYHNLLYEWSEI